MSDQALQRVIRERGNIQTLDQLAVWHESMANDFVTQEQVAKAWEGVYDRNREKARHEKIAKCLRAQIRDIQNVSEG